MPAVSVVPMPCRSWSDSDFSRTASLAPSIASRNCSPDATAARNDSSAVALATSPARWPPIPSATATRPRRSAWSRKSSSLPSRTRPTSVTPAATSRNRVTERSLRPARSLADLGDGLTELHVVAPLEARHARDLLAVHEGAVGRAEVLDVPLAVLVEQPRVQLGDVGVLAEHERASAAPSDRDLAVDRMGLTPSGRGLDDAEAQRGTGLGSAPPPRRCRGRRRRRLGRQRRRPELAHRQPHHPIEEEVQEGKEAELEDRQNGFGHECRALGRLETD